MCQVYWDVVAEEVPLARWREGYASVTELWLVERLGQKVLLGRQHRAYHMTRGLEKCFVLQELLQVASPLTGQAHRPGSQSRKALLSLLLLRRSKSRPFLEAQRKEF